MNKYSNNLSYDHFKISSVEIKLTSNRKTLLRLIFRSGLATAEDIIFVIFAYFIDIALCVLPIAIESVFRNAINNNIYDFLLSFIIESAIKLQESGYNLGAIDDSIRSI